MPHPPSRHTVTFQIGDQPVPGYRLARILGSGTFGVVWLAVTENGFERALKIVNLEQKGGKKEFRALRLIKDRKILHGNLLTLIDYWLLDRDGTILSTPNNIMVDSHVPAPQSGSTISPGTIVSDDRTAQPQIKKLAPGIGGTMMPGHDPGEAENYSARDTFQQLRNTDTTTEENSNAIWLVVAMELGHKTLHDRQKEHTQVVQSKIQTKVGRKGKTRVDNKDGTAGSNTIADRKSSQAGNEDDDLAPLSAEEVLPYMEQAARGLDYLHRCEIVHRDVKPQNIMLVGDVAKVCDYGLASELGDIRATTNAFTLPYAAPEAINKNQPAPASDQYSLAVTYVELRTGRWPFISNTSTAVYAAKDTGHHHLKFVPNRNVRAVLRKALSKRPQDRYSTCGDFVKQLAKAEATKFNLFATLQAALALLAVVTVLLAASTIHPEVRQQVLTRLAEAGILQIGGGGGGSGGDPRQFKAELEFAEELLKTNSAAALRPFELLHGKLLELPKGEKELHDRALLGLARAKAAQEGYLTSAIPRTEVLELLNQLAVPANSADGARSLQAYYLQDISDYKYETVPGVGPESELATTSLFPWERELWALARKYKIPVPEKVLSALNKIVALRREGSAASLRKSREQLKSLQDELKTTTNVPDDLRHRVALEDLHLSLAEKSLEPADHLQALQKFTNQLEVAPHLLDRAQLLRFLILGRQYQADLSYDDADAATVIDRLKPDWFDRPALDGHYFSGQEIFELGEFKNQINNETRLSTTNLAERNFAPLLQLCNKRDGYLLLCERLRGFVKQPETPKPENLNPETPRVDFAIIQTAANDLQKYLELQYPLSTLTGTELQSVVRDRADLQLEVSFADPNAVPEVVLKDFVNQAIASGDTPKWFSRLVAKASNPAWTAVASVPLRHFITNPSSDLARHPQFEDWQRKFESLQLRDVWLVDPSDPPAVQKILDALKSGSSGSLSTNAGPLPKLLMLECELLPPNTPAPDKLRDWDNRFGQALLHAEGDSELTAYGNFVRARRLALNNSKPDHDDAAELMEAALNSAQVSPWLTKSRRQGAGDVLAVAAIRSLNVKDPAAAHRFSELSLTASRQLAGWQTAVDNVKLNIPALPAVAAISRATQGGQPDWATIHDQTAAAQQDANTVALFERWQTGPLLSYVSALSALNAKPETDLPAAESVRAFQQLLLTKANNKYLYFTYGDGPTEFDEGVLLNLVNPVLNRLSPQDIAVMKTLPTKELAFLWGARGRLLQRNPPIISNDPAKANDRRISTVVAIVQANQAFDRARQLDDHIEYAVGYGRTLAILPEAPKSRTETLKEITDLIAKRTADERETNPGLRYLVAYTKRLQAYPADVPGIEAAEKLYKSLLDGLSPQQDPLGLVQPCREGLSDIHLQLAFLQDHVTAREVRLLLDKAELDKYAAEDQGTKAYHLRLAVFYGELAVSSSHLSSNENAYIALANAYEDFAYYLSVPGAYELSRRAFLDGIAAARDRDLSLAKARLSYARCLFRHAIDKLLDLSSADRQRALEDAVEQLRVALESKTLSPEYEVEANFWLAETKFALGNRAADDARFALYEQAMGAYQAATVAAQTNNLKQLQMIAISRESDARELLVRAYQRLQETSLPANAPSAVREALQNNQRQAPLNIPIHLTRAKELDEFGYRLFAASPATAKARYVTDLAANTVMTSSANRDQQKRWLTGSTAITNQWDANDEWRMAAAQLHLLLANQPDYEQEEIAAARAILPTIVDKIVRLKAEVRILEFEGTQKFNAYAASLRNNPAATPAQLAAQAEAPLAAMMQALSVRDQITGPDVVDRSKNIKDLETGELLARINQMSTSTLLTFGRELTPLQKEKLADSLNSAPSLGFRLHVVKICQALIAAARVNPQLAAAKTARTRLAHDNLKPLFVFNNTELTSLGLLKLKQDQQNFLDGFERDLRTAGVRFEDFVSPPRAP